MAVGKLFSSPYLGPAKSTDMRVGRVSTKNLSLRTSHFLVRQHQPLLALCFIKFNVINISFVVWWPETVHGFQCPINSDVICCWNEVPDETTNEIKILISQKMAWTLSISFFVSWRGNNLEFSVRSIAMFFLITLRSHSQVFSNWQSLFHRFDKNWK